MFSEKRLAAGVVLLDWFRIDAAEEHVVLRVERRDLAGRAGENLLETTRAHAEQRLVRESQPRLRNEFEIHQPLERGVMLGTNVAHDDLFRCDGVGELYAAR